MALGCYPSEETRTTWEELVKVMAASNALESSFNSRFPRLISHNCTCRNSAQEHSNSGKDRKVIDAE